jgi:hypothetical protein
MQQACPVASFYRPVNLYYTYHLNGVKTPNLRSAPLSITSITGIINAGNKKQRYHGYQLS